MNFFVGFHYCFLIAVALTVSCSTSAAQNWQFLGLSGERITAIVVDQQDGGNIYVGSGSNFSAGTTGRIFRTTNSGAVWDTLLRDITVADLDMHPFDSRILYATLGANGLTQSAVLKTTDAGLSWARADSGIRTFGLETGPTRLAIDPKSPDTLYAGTGGPQGGSFYKSTNAGQRWIDIAPEGHWLRNSILSIAINQLYPTTLYVGTAGTGILGKTTDGGNTWGASPFQSGGGGVTSITVISTCTETLFATARLPFSGRLARSFDGSTTWTIIDVPNIRERNVMCSGSTIYLDGYDSVSMGYRGHILRSTDFGITWADLGWPTTDGSTIALAIDYLGSIIYVGKQDDAGGLYKRSTLTSVVRPKGETFQYGLRQNYPNPFNPVTTIRYDVPKQAKVILRIYNTLGQEVKTLVDEIQSAGHKTIQWDSRNNAGSSVASGVYFYRMQAADFVATKKLILLR